MSATQGEAASGAFKVNSLSGLEDADAGSGRLVWDWPRSIWNMSFIAAALVLGPLFFTWSAVAVFLVAAFTVFVPLWLGRWRSVWAIAGGLGLVGSRRGLALAS